jgi:hypothetical protein
VIDDTDEFADIFAQLGEPEETAPPSVEVTEAPSKVRVPQKTETMHRYFVNRLQEFDVDTFKSENTKEYSKHCDQGHQPSVLTNEELDSILAEYDPRTYLDDDKIMKTDKGVILCPQYWCMYDRIPLQESQLVMKDGILTCPVCGGKLQSSKSGKVDVREYPVIERLKGFVYPGMKKYDTKSMPCCFKTPRAQKTKLVEKEDEKYYIVGEIKTGLKPYRLAYLSTSLMSSLKIQLTYKEMIASQNRIASGTSGYFRVGMGRASETLPMLMGLKTKIPDPKDAISTVLKCSFLPSWTAPDDVYVDEIRESIELEGVSKEEVARLISGIQTAYAKGTMTPIQELEYTALCLKTNIFRILTDSNTLACTFFTQTSIPRTRAIIALQRDSEIDILAYVTRVGRTFTFKSNVFEPPFTREQYIELERMNLTACTTKVPSGNVAILASRSLVEEFGDDIVVIMDPYGRTQAFLFPNKMILPFVSTAMLDTIYPKVSGYSAIRDRLPTKESVMKSLELLKSTQFNMYEYESDIYDSEGNVVEIALKNGLRIPIVPVKGDVRMSENTAEMQNILTEPESTLVFGTRNSADYLRYKEISYASEVYNYLIFELTKDIERDRNDIAIAIKSLDEQKLERVLQEWFETAIQSTDSPIEFLSKIRVPCGQFTNKSMCETGSMCGWNGNVCRIKVRKEVSRTALFRKLLNGLIENSKLRAMVLEGRTTPFFSTILYMELPHEVILTDLELKSE